MKIEFWGVRGAFPTPDPDKIRYGGNTNCIIITSSGAPQHLFILDAGTGLARFGTTLNHTQEYQATLLLSHLHLQHIIGFQFTPFAFNPNFTTQVIGPSHRNMSMPDVFDGIMEAHFSPVHGIANLLAKVQFEEIDSRLRQIGEVMILSMPFEHTLDTDSWGYRLQDRNGAVVYLTDAQLRENDGTLTQRAIRLSVDVDVLIVGADDPYHQREESTSYADAIELAHLSHAKHLILYHHNPAVTDSELDGLQTALRASHPDMQITIASERLVVEL